LTKEGDKTPGLEAKRQLSFTVMENYFFLDKEADHKADNIGNHLAQHRIP